jgi:hypothetical protein
VQPLRLPGARLLVIRDSRLVSTWYVLAPSGGGVLIRPGPAQFQPCGLSIACAWIFDALLGESCCFRTGRRMLGELGGNAAGKLAG